MHVLVIPRARLLWIYFYFASFHVVLSAIEEFCREGLHPQMDKGGKGGRVFVWDTMFTIFYVYPVTSS